MNENLTTEAKKEKEKFYKVYAADRDKVVKTLEYLGNKEPNFKGRIESYFADYLYAGYCQKVAEELFSNRGTHPDKDEYEAAINDYKHYEKISKDVLKAYITHRKEELKIMETILKNYNINL